MDRRMENGPKDTSHHVKREKRQRRGGEDGGSDCRCSHARWPSTSKKHSRPSNASTTLAVAFFPLPSTALLSFCSLLTHCRRSRLAAQMTLRPREGALRNECDCRECAQHSTRQAGGGAGLLSPGLSFFSSLL